MRDDLEFIAVITQPVSGADVFQVVDQFGGAFLEIEGYQGITPIKAVW